MNYIQNQRIKQLKLYIQQHNYLKKLLTTNTILIMTLNCLSSTSPTTEFDHFIQDERDFFQYQMQMLVKSNQKLSKLQNKMKSIINKNNKFTDNQNTLNVPFDYIKKDTQKVATKKPNNSRTLITEQNLLNNQQDYQEQEYGQNFYKNKTNPIINKSRNSYHQHQHESNRKMSKQYHEQIPIQSEVNKRKSSLKIFPKKKSSTSNNQKVNVHIIQNKKIGIQNQKQEQSFYSKNSQYQHQHQQQHRSQYQHQNQNQYSRRPSASKAKTQFEKQYRQQLMQQIQSIEEMMKKCANLKQQKIQQLLYEIQRDKEEKLILYEKNQKLEKQLKQLNEIIVSDNGNASQYSANLEKKQIQLLTTLQCQEKRLKNQAKSLKFEVKSMQRHFNNLLKKRYHQNKLTSKQKSKERLINNNQNKSLKSLKHCCQSKSKNQAYNKSINEKKLISSSATIRKTQQNVLKSLVTQLNKIKGLVLNQIVRTKSKSQIASSFKYR